MILHFNDFTSCFLSFNIDALKLIFLVSFLFVKML